MAGKRAIFVGLAIFGAAAAFGIAGVNMVGNGPSYIGGSPFTGANTPQSTSLPASWQVATWCVDPQNVSGIASDTNTCTACGHPCLSYTQIAARWGTYAPRLQQATTIAFISSHTDNTDPVYYWGEGENGGSLTLQGTPTVTCTGTLANVVAKNRATQQLLNASVTGGDGGACTLATGQLVTNSTHPSVAFAKSLVSGSTWSLSQPGTDVAPPATSSQAEVDTWANGDAVTVSTLPLVNLVSVEPTAADTSSYLSETGGAYLYQLGVYDPALCFGAYHCNSLAVNMQVTASDVYARRVLSLGASPENASGLYGSATWSNVFAEGGIVGGPPSNNLLLASNLLHFNGGIIGSAAAGSDAWMNAIYLEDDAIFANTGSSNMATIGLLWSHLAYIETGTITAQNAQFNAYGTSITWGSGSLKVLGTAHYAAGAGAAATTFKLAGGFSANGQIRACLGVPTAATTTLTCNLALTAAQLDTSLGATTGCLYTPGGGAGFCNY